MSSPAFLTPPVAQRPMAKRLHSLPSPRIHPYCPPPSLSPASPLLSPNSTAAGPSSYSPFHPTSAPCTPGPGYPKRPGAPKRAHSFCASSANSSYALASTAAASHLSHNKRELVAPPLERTLSSFGSTGNTSPPEYRMERPRRAPLQPIDTNDALFPLSSAISPLPTPPSSPLPRIVVSSSSTPPRPSINPRQTYDSDCASRSTSYDTIIATPTSPRPTLFGMIEEDEETCSESPTILSKRSDSPTEQLALQQVASNLGRMAV